MRSSGDLFCDTTNDLVNCATSKDLTTLLRMGELAEARAELARLKEKERDLVNQLLAVRAEISFQNINISSLIKVRRRPAIHLLPSEILISIFDLVIHDNQYYYSMGNQMQQLAGVSRQWRDLILDTPTLWSTIVVTEKDSKFAETCVKKSRETLLDIIVKSISPVLEVVMSYKHRWRSLTLIDNAWGRPSLGDVFVKKIENLDFPSLRHVTIPSLMDTSYPNFLFSTRTPALEHLQVGSSRTWNDFCPVPTLKSLDLTFSMHADYGRSFLYLIPTQSLTRLSLSGRIDTWILQSNSIRFPHLKALTLSINRINMFLKAIVAPNLERFVYSLPNGDARPSELFNGLDSKFDNVHYFRFSSVYWKPINNTTDAKALCRAFPHVHHVELDRNGVLGLFTLRSPCGKFRADLWSDLESLTLHNPSTSWLGDLELFKSWLVERRRLHSRLTRVKVTGIEACHDETLLQCFYHWHCTLKDICTIDLGMLPMMFKANIYFGHDSSPMLVSLLSYLNFYGIHY